MFGGIVEASGTLKNRSDLKKGIRLYIEAPFHFKDDVKSGDSIAVNGACLTITKWENNVFVTDISPETLMKSTLGDVEPESRLNLERALKLSDRINGHLVTGHIDGVAEISEIVPMAEFTKMVFKLPQHLENDVVKKGSIAIDGVSLTVNEVSNDSVEVMLIPETLEKTTLGEKKVGDKIQVELDLIGKYVKKWINK